MNKPDDILQGKLRKLRSFIKKQKYIRVAYLFGSAATGKTGPLSDIDLAFYLDERLSKSQRHSKLLLFISKITVILGTDRVDVVIMNDAPLLLNFNIIKNGKVIACNSNSKRVVFEARIMCEFLDRNYYDSMFIKKDFERIEKVGLSCS